MFQIAPEDIDFPISYDFARWFNHQNNWGLYMPLVVDEPEIHPLNDVDFEKLIEDSIPPEKPKKERQVLLPIKLRSRGGVELP